MISKIIKKIFDVLNRISVWLSKISFIAWVFVYLLTIISFAFLYSFSSAKFYHNTIKYEESYQVLENNLSVAIQNEIKQSFTEKANHHTTKINGWLVRHDEIMVSNIHEDNGKLLFSIWLQAINCSTASHTETDSIFVQYTLRRDAILNGEKFMIGDKIYFPINFSPVPDSFVDIPNIEDLNFSSLFTGNTIPIPSLCVASATELEINNFMIASGGFPTNAPNKFGIMLYLSAVTITTLGYGDIVPINDIARLMVGLEATLGILLLGLILNSATRKNES